MKYGSVVAIAGTVCLFILQGVNARGDELLSDAKRYFAPLPDRIDSPESNPTTKNRTALGKKLFYDPRLSLSGVISCNTCHNLATYGSDNLSSSLGHKFKTGGRNAPTVLNAGLHIAQFWDGRAKDLEEQAKGPVLNPLEMAMPNPDLVIARLRSIPSYGEEFRAAFGGESNPVNYDNVAKAIAAFERTLLTPSRFDNYLKGDEGALTKAEKRGLKLFISKGCTACHNGAALGGGAYMKFGIVKPYGNKKDLGRYEVTKNDADKFVFKVPSLRNITRTYPYFHDGAVWDLKEAVRIMGRTQLGMELRDDEVDKITTFLDSLTGVIPHDALVLPVLPPSTPNTPKPAL
ncbi:MAG: cytochrome-c peroxidase [Thermodesulfobacteriota bacterium]